MRDGGARLLGLLAIGFFIVHAGYHVARGHPEDVLWMCHLATLGVGIALLTRAPTLNAGAVLWLAIGVPLWALYLAFGGVFHPTSVLTHLGGLAVGLAGVRRLGARRGVRVTALAALVGLVLACRAVTPERADVNLAFTIWPARGPVSPMHIGAVLATLPLTAVAFRGVEWGLLRIVAR